MKEVRRFVLYESSFCGGSCLHPLLSFVGMYHTVECEGDLSNDMNECYVMDGRMTLYSTSPIGQSSVDGIRDVIQIAMDEGDYNNLDPRLVKVSYREDLETTDSDAGEGNAPKSTGGSDPVPSYVYPIIIVAMVLSFLVAGIPYARQQCNRGNTRAGSFPSRTVDRAVV